MKAVRAPRKKPQQQRSQATVEAILDAAAHLFCARSYATTSTNAIAERAGVSIGSLYQYFPNKLALLEALRERYVKALWEAIGHACGETKSMSLPVALRHIISRCSAYNSRHVTLAALLHRELPVHAQNMDRLIVAQATLQRQLRQLLEAHQASLKVSVDQALFMMPALGRGIFTTAALEQPDAVEEQRLVDDIVSVMLGYLT